MYLKTDDGHRLVENVDPRRDFGRWQATIAAFVKEVNPALIKPVGARLGIVGTHTTER